MTRTLAIAITFLLPETANPALPVFNPLASTEALLSAIFTFIFFASCALFLWLDFENQSRLKRIRNAAASMRKEDHN